MLGKLILQIERKRRKLYQAAMEDRLRVSRELDGLIIEYMKFKGGSQWTA